jgi:hypothetical protein
MAVLDSLPMARVKESLWVDLEGKTRARSMDRLARRAFPIAFLAFNVVYWTAYALPSFSFIDS